MPKIYLKAFQRDPVGILQGHRTKTFQPYPELPTTSSIPTLLEDEKKVTWDKYVKDFGEC